MAIQVHITPNRVLLRRDPHVGGEPCDTTAARREIDRRRNGVVRHVALDTCEKGGRVYVDVAASPSIANFSVVPVRDHDNGGAVGDVVIPAADLCPVVACVDRVPGAVQLRVRRRLQWRDALGGS